MTAREREVKNSRADISDDRLIRFLRAVRDAEVTACRLINDHLDSHEDLDSIFYTNEQYGYHLTVEKLSDNAFKIKFGCIVAPLTGDGGEWEVVYGTDGEILSVAGGMCWIS